MWHILLYYVPNIGDPAPNFSGKDVLTGQDWSLLDHQGKVVLIAFNGLPWCDPCRYEVPILQEIHNQLQETPCLNFEFVLVNSSGDDLDGLKTFLNINDISIPVIEDFSIMSELYDTTTVPTLIILDKNHKICAKIAGASPPPTETKNKINYALEECGLKCKPPVVAVNNNRDPDAVFSESIKIIIGIIEGGGGVIFPVGPVPPIDPLHTMDIDKRDILTALAISQISNQLTDIGAQRDLEIRSLKAAATAMKRLMKKAELRPTSVEKSWMPLPKPSHDCHDKS